MFLTFGLTHKMRLFLLLIAMSEGKPRYPHHPAPGRHIEPPGNYPEEADRVTGKISWTSKSGPTGGRNEYEPATALTEENKGTKFTLKKSKK